MRLNAVRRPMPIIHARNMAASIRESRQKTRKAQKPSPSHVVHPEQALDADAQNLELPAALQKVELALQVRQGEIPAHRGILAS